MIYNIFLIELVQLEISHTVVCIFVTYICVCLLQMNVLYKHLSANQTLAGHLPTRVCLRNRAWLTPPTVTTVCRLRPSTRAVYWIGIWTTPCGTWWRRRPMASPQPARGGATLSHSAPTNVIEMLSPRHHPMKQRPTLSTIWVRDVSFCLCVGHQ